MTRTATLFCIIGFILSGQLLSGTGVQTDIKRASGAAGRDVSWDGVWDSETRITDNGTGHSRRQSSRETITQITMHSISI